ncbi:hypothetical protein GXP67_07840 [Rhodocytophaga rosea]|uniref:Uncharacterized protein n=1 Tax=Rhodocytophaga rosea TaxID=2704465 RepID=A0A6C0GFP1_9BACT|nr:hypothetical protein [Rhodocytophaga rosea]QHT66572.1 hypothetical protein GXP67_07840 [Rhodocytophaga rosea]
MDIKQAEKSLIEFTRKHKLKEKALQSISEFDINLFGGYQRSALKFEFERHELHVENDHKCAVIRTRIGIYIDDPKGIWYKRLEPIGYYELEVDLDGEVLDDYLIIDKNKN